MAPQYKWLAFPPQANPLCKRHGSFRVLGGYLSVQGSLEPPAVKRETDDSGGRARMAAAVDAA